VDPVPNPPLLRKNLVVPGIEPESSGSVPRNFDPLDHRGGPSVIRAMNDLAALQEESLSSEYL
jgi:hypothetical protein